MTRKNRLLAAALAATMLGATGTANAGEHCYAKYRPQIAAANGELVTHLDRIKQLEAEITAEKAAKGAKASELAEIVTREGYSQRAQQVANEIQALDKSITLKGAEVYQRQDRVLALKHQIQPQLAGEVRGCVDATKDATTTVNVLIQSLAILSTGPAAFAAPPKALYVDMSAVLHGYPLGGPKSAVNSARDAALKELGIGGDAATIIKDPAKPLRDAAKRLGL